MKTLVQIERNWIKYCDELAVKYGLSAAHFYQMRDEIAKEVGFLFQHKDSFLVLLQERTLKYERLVQDAVQLEQMDKWWRQRLDFWKWCAL
jgi:hypothetical protein